MSPHRINSTRCLSIALAAISVIAPICPVVQVAAFATVTCILPKLSQLSSPSLTSTFTLCASSKNDENGHHADPPIISSYQTNNPNNDDNKPKSSFTNNNNFNGNINNKKQLSQETAPACPIEDEDCLAFSTIYNTANPSFYNLPVDEHPDYQPPNPPYQSLLDPQDGTLCEVEDIDCQTLVPSTYLHSDAYLSHSFQSRYDSIRKDKIVQNWKMAKCPTTFVSISKEDWVRRVDMERYPRVVCGSARGSVYVVDLEEGKVEGMAEAVHSVQVPEAKGLKSGDSDDDNAQRRRIARRVRGAKKAKQAMEKLYGKLDGGGVVAISIHKDVVASSGREGGVKLWKIGQSEDGVCALKSIGSIPDLKLTIVTSLKFDSGGLLWASGYDGTVRAYDVSTCLTSSKLPPSPKPVFRTDFTDSVLDMKLCEDIGCGVCATVDGTAALFSLRDGQFFMGIKLFEVAARSVLIVKDNDSEDKEYSVVCGGVDGTLHRIGLNIGAISGTVNEENPFDVTATTETVVKPKHTGPVMCLASPSNGMFLSGGQDGALRVWDCYNDCAANSNADSQHRPCKCLYALTGYKMWLGSACTDFNYLVSDGGENSIIVRDYSVLENNAEW
mmetsp:Transcript_31549/g.63143  ORF Transcript_31549/g.63143 Transcript_31549/m.63143 type:complete len:613 (+) Transcript_31549:128-1966(+)